MTQATAAATRQPLPQPPWPPPPKKLSDGKRLALEKKFIYKNFCY